VFDLTQEPKLNHHVEVLGGVLEQESQTLIKHFFRQLRTE
jgi:tRNA(adenine34) deaminase